MPVLALGSRRFKMAINVAIIQYGSIAQTSLTSDFQQTSVRMEPPDQGQTPEKASAPTALKSVVTASTSSQQRTILP